MAGNIVRSGILALVALFIFLLTALFAEGVVFR